MKSSLGFRRSAKETAPANAAYNPQTLPTLSKPVSATVPPKKVIRALSSYRASAPQELSFTKGDFFYVIRDVSHTNGSDYYEAHNPVTGARGLVPREMFEGFDKANAAQRVISTAGPGARISGPVSPPQAIRYSNHPTSPKATPVFYAVVQHDFQAERPDELDAKAGDAISVVAHSNREWFVAKPIGKLGGPGLIPASFLEVRDPLTGQAITDLDDLIDRGELPPVEEWKRATMSYKANSIALGVVDSPNGGSVLNSQFQKMAVTSPGAENRYTYGAGSPSGYMPPHEERSSVVDQPHQPQHINHPPPQDEPLPVADISRLEVINPLPAGVLIRAEVSSFHFEANDWVFRINATFKPDSPAKKNPFDPNPPMSRELTLFRVYDDFYVFQIHLLRTFPIEAGRDPDHPDDLPPEEEEGPGTRILPYMPGPQDEVDETVTDTRRHDLDIYLKELVALREVGAEHILRCELVRKFFAARDGDIENEVPLPDGEDEYSGQGGNGIKNYYNQTNGHSSPRSEPRQTSEYNTSYNHRQPQISGGNAYTRHTAETSQYAGQESGHPYARARPTVSQDRDSGDGGGYSRQSEMDRNQGWKEEQHAHPYAREPSGGSVSSPTTRLNNPPFPSPPRRNASPQRSPYAQSSTRDRDSDYRGHNSTYSTSTANISSSGNPNSPRISSGNPNAAFVKIKIFHSSTDELIAIRVSPRVTLRQLMEKTRERLGNNVEN
ncbi:bud emergence protein 1, partial [Serendipita sp. 399]